MPLPFHPPLSPHEQAILATLPKLNGSVVSPDYYPRQYRLSGEREFLAWCEANERTEWPQWVNDWHIRYHLRHPSDQRPAGEGDDAQAVGRADQEREVAG